MIVARAQQSFPARNHERKNALHLVVMSTMRHVHAGRYQAQTSRGVHGSSSPGLNEWTRYRVDFVETRIGQPFLRGERVGNQRTGRGAESEGILYIEKSMGFSPPLHRNYSAWRVRKHS